MSLGRGRLVATITGRPAKSPYSRRVPSMGKPPGRPIDTFVGMLVQSSNCEVGDDFGGLFVLPTPSKSSVKFSSFRANKPCGGLPLRVLNVARFSELRFH